MIWLRDTLIISPITMVKFWLIFLKLKHLKNCMTQMVQTKENLDYLEHFYKHITDIMLKASFSKKYTIIHLCFKKMKIILETHSSRQVKVMIKLIWQWLQAYSQDIGHYFTEFPGKQKYQVVSFSPLHMVQLTTKPFYHLLCLNFKKP